MAPLAQAESPLNAELSASLAKGQSVRASAVIRTVLATLTLLQHVVLKAPLAGTGATLALHESGALLAVARALFIEAPPTDFEPTPPDVSRRQHPRAAASTHGPTCHQISRHPARPTAHTTRQGPPRTPRATRCSRRGVVAARRRLSGRGRTRGLTRSSWSARSR